MFLEIKLVSFSNSLICCFQSGSKHMRLCQESQMISPGPEAIQLFSNSAEHKISTAYKCSNSKKLWEIQVKHLKTGNLSC